VKLHRNSPLRCTEVDETNLPQGARALSPILYIATSSNASPTGGGRTRIISEARQIQGCSTATLLCFVPVGQLRFYGFRELEVRRRKLEDEIGGKVLYVPRLPMRRLAPVRLLDRWYSVFLILFFALRHRAKVLHGHGFGATFLACMVKRIRSGINVVADVHGASVDEYLYATASLSDVGTVRLFEHEERVSLTEPNWIIFVSEAMRAYYQDKYETQFKYSTVIPCATDGTIDVSRAERENLRDQLGLSGKIVFCYVGSCEEYQLPDAMCAFFKAVLMKRSNVHFMIISHHRETFKAYLRGAGIQDRYYTIRSVEHREVFRLLSVGDLGFLLRLDSVVNRVASPTKFAEYALCGIPVITTPYVGDTSKWVQEYAIGISVEPGDLTNLPELVSYLDQVWRHRADYAERCRSFAHKELTWDVYRGALLGIYAHLSSRG
jgi:glycosyltransferase involved in cell wall biosynthesis